MVDPDDIAELDSEESAESLDKSIIEIITRKMPAITLT